MPNILRTLLSDTLALARVGGPAFAARWVMQVAANLPQCLALRNLQAADAAMGPGPFDLALRGARAKCVGDQVVSGIREIWARDVYLGGGYLTIRDGDRVVDLGANMGNFTALALGHGPRVRVVSVEANPALLEQLARTLSVNGFADRATVINAFVGGETEKQADLRARPGIAGVPFLSEAELIARGGLDHIDFLKCDIEGSEFDLLGPESRLLSMTRQLAIEVHRFPGKDADGFRPMLSRLGFEVRVSRENRADLTLLARR
jgi:FkbM family methyltransferase